MLIFQKVKNGGMSICVNCAHRKVCKGIDNQPCTECNQFFNEDKQPKTRADRIRAMSDEELARCLLTVDDAGKYCKNLQECGELLDTPEGIPEEKCLGCLVEWLREPEGEGHEQKP